MASNHSRTTVGTTITTNHNITIAGVAGLGTLRYHFKVAAAFASQLTRDYTPYRVKMGCILAQMHTQTLTRAQINLSSQLWVLFLMLLISTTSNSCSGGTRANAVSNLAFSRTINLSHLNLDLTPLLLVRSTCLELNHTALPHSHPPHRHARTHLHAHAYAHTPLSAFLPRSRAFLPRSRAELRRAVSTCMRAGSAKLQPPIAQKREHQVVCGAGVRKPVACYC